MAEKSKPFPQPSDKLKKKKNWPCAIYFCNTSKPQEIHYSPTDGVIYFVQIGNNLHLLISQLPTLYLLASILVGLTKCATCWSSRTNKKTKSSLSYILLKPYSLQPSGIVTKQQKPIKYTFYNNGAYNSFINSIL